MLCPDCLEKQQTVRMGIEDSRPDGPFKRHRRYRCPKCKYETWTTEILPISIMVKISALKTAS
jgi:transposase-like protein